MYRNLLKICILLMLSGGLLAGLSPMFSSLQPNSRAENATPQFDISNIRVDQTARFYTNKLAIFVTRINEQNLEVVAVPYKDGYFLLPEFNWDKPRLPCKNFVQEDGFQCLDKENGELHWYSFMKWNKQGVYVSKTEWHRQLPNLITPKHKIKNGRFVYLGSDI